MNVAGFEDPRATGMFSRLLVDDRVVPGREDVGALASLPMKERPP